MVILPIEFRNILSSFFLSFCSILTRSSH